MTPIPADLTFEEMTDEQREQYAFLTAAATLTKLTPDVHGCLLIVLGKGIMGAGAACRRGVGDRTKILAQLRVVLAGLESQTWGDEKSFESGDEE